MNTKVLEYILAISEEGSISKAADRFYLAQPALSAHLKTLESEYGTPLFYRSQGKMILTKAGVLFVNNARLVLHHEKELYEEIERIKNENKKTIHFLTERSYRNYIVQNLVPAFTNMHPDVQLIIETANATKALKAIRDDQADFAICVLEELTVPGLCSEAIGIGSLILGFHPDYKGPKSLGELSGEIEQGLLPALHPVGTTTRMLEDRALAKANLAPKAVLEIQTFHNAIDFVKYAKSFAFFPIDFGPLSESKIVTSPPVIGYNTLLVQPDKAFLSKELIDFKTLLVATMTEFQTRKTL